MTVPSGALPERGLSERAAFERLREGGDERLREQLIERYMPLVRHLASRYARAVEPLEDVVQAGSIGLLNAIDRFDPQNGSAFSSYAVPTILGEIRRHFRDHTWTVRVPRSLKDLSAQARDAEVALERRLGRTPTAQELADELDTDVERLLEARLAAATQYPDSFDEPLGRDADGVAFHERVGTDDPELGRAADALTIELLTSRLSAREQEILRLRFEQDLTQQEIGERVGYSQMHVSRMLRSALAELETVIERQPLPET